MADPAIEHPDLNDRQEIDTSPQVQRLTSREMAKVYRLRFIEGLTLEAISKTLKRSLSCVHYCVASFEESTVEPAERWLKGHALAAGAVTTDLLTNDDPKLRHSAARTVLQSAGLLTPQTQVNIGVQVVHGTPGTPAGYDPFEAKVVETSHLIPPAKS